MNQMAWGILVTCGKDEQMASGVDVSYLDLAGKAVLSYSLQAFEQSHEIAGVVLVAAPERVEQTLGLCQLHGFAKIRKVVPGAATFFGSVQHGLKYVSDDAQCVCLHGAGRPCIQGNLISEVVKAARKDGAAAAGAPVGGQLLAAGKGDVVKEVVDASALWQLQSPVACRRDWLKLALETAAKKKKHPADIVEALSLIKKSVTLVANPRPNLHLRQPTDLMMAVALLA
jgi:2-C-methyl-D-erythritol 4-phosphate cytidylyltransferase